MLTLLALVAMAATAAACSDGDDDVPDGRALMTTPFVTFDGEEVRLDDHRGKPIVVNFFASWCTPCIAAMPDFETVHRELGDRVMFVGLNYDDPVDKGAELVRRTGVTYLVGRDVDGKLFRAAEGIQMPTTVFIRSDGTVADVRSRALNADTLRATIREELGVT